MASPEIEPSRLHPVVWSTAQRLWNDGHLRLAVAAAAEAVTGQMKQLTRRNDAADTTLWQQAFSERPPEVGKSRLRWPGDPTDQGVKTMNDGLRQFAPGVNMVIRNPATHTDEEIAEQDALEKLAVLSSLMRFVDRCEVAAAPVDRAPATTER
nr:TIGR02391 family protein [Leifsonia sp. C5G2]